jgi:hypothetical protein
MAFEPPERMGWKSLECVPLNEDVSVLVSDGHGEPYRLSFPCKLTEAGWVSSGKGTLLAVTPLKWRIYFNRQPPGASTSIQRSNRRGSALRPRSAITFPISQRGCTGGFGK